MKIIEFCGPPCSGKTFIKNLILKNEKNFINSDYLIYDYANSYIELSNLEKLTLKYYKYLKFFKTNKKSVNIIKKKTKKINSNTFKKLKKNKLSFLFLKTYKNLCKKIFHLQINEKPEFFNLINYLLKKIKDKSKRNKIKEWYYETSAKYYIAKRIKSNKTVVFDEGFAQRSIFFLNFKNNYKYNLEKYISLSIKPNYLVFIDNKENLILKRSNNRLNKNLTSFTYKNLNEVKKYKSFFRNYLKIINNIKK